MAGGYKTPQDDLEVFAEAIKALQGQVRELERPTGTQLAQAVATLAEQQAELAAQLANQVYPDAKSTYQTGMAFGTSVTTVATLTFTVPTGYTRALVTATGFISAGPVSSGDRIYSIITIAGSVGGETYGFLDSSIGGQSGASHVASLTGVSGTFDVSISARTLLDDVFSASSRVSLSASVSFQK